MPAAGRAVVSRLSSGGTDNDLRRGHAATTSCGIARPTRRPNCGACSPTPTGVKHTISIPPPLIRREAIVEMRAAGERLVAPQFLPILRLMDEPMLQPIYDLETPRMALRPRRYRGGRAFVARPHVAAGVSKAADDATALVEALGAGRGSRTGAAAFRGGAAAVGRRIIERARILAPTCKPPARWRSRRVRSATATRRR